MAYSSLLVVGSVALDDIHTPYGSRTRVLGGSASYFATAASYFTPGAVQLVGVVGEDFSEDHVQFFAAHGIDLLGLERRPGPTFHWIGRYSDDLLHRTTLNTQLGVFAGFQPKLNAAHQAARFVFLGNIDPSLQISVLEQVRQPYFVASDTMNFWIAGKPQELRRMLQHVNLFLANDEEICELIGARNLVVAAQKVRELGPTNVVIKRGSAGALLFYEGGVFAAPAYPLEDVRDPTGAGDTFAGGMLGYLARCGEVTPSILKRAMIYGSVMASFCVEDFSLDRLRTLTLEQINNRCSAFYELTHFEQTGL